MQGIVIGFALVGCGAVGRKRAAALSGARLLYACDLEAPRAADLARTAPGCQAVTDPAVVLHDPAVDAVIVSTLNASLGPISLAAVRAGKHVLVEKPGALTADELREVQNAAARSGVRVRLGYNHRFHPALQKSRELVDAGAVGPLMFVRGRLRTWRPEGI